MPSRSHRPVGSLHPDPRRGEHRRRRATAAAAIDAVGLGPVTLVVGGCLGFLRRGSLGLIAQSRGAGDDAEDVHLLLALSIGLVLVVVIAVVRAPLNAGPLHFPLPRPRSIRLQGDIWLSVSGASPRLAIHAIICWLIARECARAVLVSRFVMNGLSIIQSNWLLLGCAGRRNGNSDRSIYRAGHRVVVRAPRPVRDDREWLFAQGRMQRLVGAYGDILIRSVLRQDSFTIFMFMAAGQGDRTLTANRVLQLLKIAACVLNGFVFAVEALVGQAVGARKPDRLCAAVRICTTTRVIGLVAISAV